MSVLIPGLVGGQPAPGGLRAYSDPVIFRDDRVLKTLLRKEAKYLPASANYFVEVQFDLKPAMRKEVADWMLEVCEDQQSQPEVFCLAINYMDRFLSLCSISQSQLQLLGAVCLLVAWKVRQHEPLAASRLVEYSDYNLDLVDIMEWEVLLLSKLDWDMSAVIALDFVEHIIQRVKRLPLGWNAEVIRRHSETLVPMCSANHAFSSLAPSLIAAACVLTTLRPLLEAAREPSMMVTNNPGPSPAHQRIPDLAIALEIVGKMTQLDKDIMLDTMDQIEVLMRASCPPSPNHSQRQARRVIYGQLTPKKDDMTVAPSCDESEEVTPTKVLDVAMKDH